MKHVFWLSSTNYTTNHQIIYQGQFLIIEVLQLINKERMLELEDHHFVTPNCGRL